MAVKVINFHRSTLYYKLSILFKTADFKKKFVTTDVVQNKILKNFIPWAYFPKVSRFREKYHILKIELLIVVKFCVQFLSFPSVLWKRANYEAPHMKFSPDSRYILSFVPYTLNTLFSNTFNHCYSLNMRNQFPLLAKV
jgi:hypothetical protein